MTMESQVADLLIFLSWLLAVTPAASAVAIVDTMARRREILLMCPKNGGP